MATILAHIRVNEGAEAAFEAVARTLHDATHAHETRVRRYEYWRGAEPRTYYTLLSFDDFEAFIEHQTSDHHEVASPAMRGLFESFRLEWVDPVPGASGLTPTASQDLSGADDELTRVYAERFAAQIADWWSQIPADRPAG